MPLNPYMTFYWVSRNAGITGNKHVNSLAHSSTILGCHRFMKVPACDYFHSFSSFILSCWQSFWSDLSNTILHAVKPSISPWQTRHKNRRWNTALPPLCRGHTNLIHSYLMTHSPLTFRMTFITLLSVSHFFFFVTLMQLSLT